MSLVHYFVDEAGDSTLFNRKGKLLIGDEGNSRFFIMGLLYVKDPESLNESLCLLRSELLADPYFRNVPSMHPDQKKTAIAFHAKDDIPEVRREVYKILKNRQDIRFIAVIGDKFSTFEYVKNRQLREPSYRYHPDEMYDFLTRRLFRDQLSKEEEYKVVFAQRGNRKRTAKLKEQLHVAQQRHLEKHPFSTASKINVQCGLSKMYSGLQAADYYLWALQRLFERKEDRFLINIWQQCKLVIDIHDLRNNPYGEYYTKHNPLTLEKIMDRF